VVCREAGISADCGEAGLDEESTGGAPLENVEVDETQPVAVKPWGSLAHPQFSLLASTWFISALGQQMRQITNLYLVYQLSGSTLQLGLVGLFQGGPAILLGIFGGSLADLVDRKKLIIISEATSMVLAAVLAGLTLSGNIEVWHIYVITVGASAINVFEQPARTALIPSLVPRSHLTNAITLNSTIRHATMLFGPAVGGLLIDWQGAGSTYLINAVLFVPVVIALMFLRVPVGQYARGIRYFTVSHMVEGLKFIWSTHIILALIVLDTVAAISTGYRGLMPVFAEDILGVGASGLGLLLSAPAVGFLVGAGVLLMMGDIRHKGAVVLVSLLGYLVAIAVFSQSKSYVLSLVLIAAVGGLDGVATIMRQTTTQLLVPDEIRGRATSVHQAFARGSPSLGYLVMGALAVQLGAPGALLAGSGFAAVVLVVVGLKWREVISYRS
jgi:MFS family permease